MRFLLYLLPSAYCLRLTVFSLLFSLLSLAYCLQLTAFSLLSSAYSSAYCLQLTLQLTAFSLFFSLLPSAYCLQLIAFSLLPSAHCLQIIAFSLLFSLLPSAYCLQFIVFSLETDGFILRDVFNMHNRANRSAHLRAPIQPGQQGGFAEGEGASVAGPTDKPVQGSEPPGVVEPSEGPHEEAPQQVAKPSSNAQASNSGEVTIPTVPLQAIPLGQSSEDPEAAVGN
nr:hypothetical protein CFP56_44132 [Quercus suber]